MIDRVKQIWNLIPKWLRNRYVITLGIFALIFLFFNQDNVFQLYNRKRTLKTLEKQIETYNEELIQLKEQQRAFQDDKEALEKFAREEYRMKKDDEDVFVIVEDSEDKK